MKGDEGGSGDSDDEDFLVTKLNPFGKSSGAALFTEADDREILCGTGERCLSVASATVAPPVGWSRRESN